jgi:hypothetical protein
LLAIVFHLLTTKEAYNESIFHKTEEETLRRAQYRLADKLPNSDFRSSPRRTADVPWESACVQKQDAAVSAQAPIRGIAHTQGLHRTSREQIERRMEIGNDGRVR